jgi:MYXO-CTERM domain-containing protein
MLRTLRRSRLLLATLGIAAASPLAIAKAGAPIANPPVAGAEIDLDPGFAAPGTLAYNTARAVGTDGQSFLFVYYDEDASHARLLFQRIGVNGLTADAQPRVLADATYDSRTSIARAPGGWLVTFTGGPSTQSIQSAFIASNGTASPAKTIVTNPGSSIYNVSVAASTNGYLVVWNAGSAVMAASLDASGAIVGKPMTVHTFAKSSNAEPMVAASDGVFLVTWGEDTNVLAARVSFAGALLDAAPLTIATTRSDYWGSVLGAAGGDGGFLVAWADTRGLDKVDLYGARIKSDGTLIDPSGIALSTAVGAQSAPAIAFASGEYSVAWGSDGGVFATRVLEKDGSVTHANGLAIAPSAKYGPAIAANAFATYAIWTEGTNTDVVPHGARIDALGHISQPIATLAPHTYAEDQTTVAASGHGYLSAWRVADGTFWLRRLDMHGAPLGDPAELYSGAGQNATRTLPRIAWTGSDWFVTWAARGPFYTWGQGVHVEDDGSVVESDPISLSAGSDVTSFVTAGAKGLALVAWLDSFGANYTLVNADGSIAANAVTIAKAPASGSWGGVAVASDGATFEVAYATPSGLFAARIDPADPSKPALATIATASGLGDIALAYGPLGYLAVTQTTQGLVGYRFDSKATTVSGPLALNVNGRPTLTYDGAEFLLGWGAATGTGGFSASAIALDAMGGSPSSTFPLFGEAIADSAPTLASGGGGRAIAAASRTTPVRQAAGVRPLRTTIGAGAACLEDADCGSGHCVDGVCCDTACGGGATDDCSACSVAAGAVTDGVCGAVQTPHCAPASTDAGEAGADSGSLADAGTDAPIDAPIDAPPPPDHTPDAASADASPSPDASPAPLEPVDTGCAIAATSPHGASAPAILALATLLTAFGLRRRRD